MKFHGYLCACLTIIGLFSVAAPSYANISSLTKSLTQANKKVKVPKWEISLSSLYFSLPHYPGSNHIRQLFLPAIPFITYHFKNINTDKNALSLRANANTVLKIDFGLRLPVEPASKSAEKPSGRTVISSTNFHRKGMEKRNLLLKVGVQVTHSLTSNININLPLLVNLNVQNFGQAEGYEINPAIEFNLFPQLNTRETRLRMRFRWSYANKELSNYFYQVKPKEVLPDRHAYNANAGEIERTFDIAFFHKYSKNFSYFLAWRYHDYSHSANRNSPLYITENQQSFGVGLIYSLARSNTMIERFPNL